MKHVTDLDAQDVNGAVRLTEDAIALEFTRRHGDELRYVHEWNRWLHWDGRRWAPERTLAVYDLARILVREMGGSTANSARHARMENARTVYGAVTLARADRVHARVTEDFDADGWLFNTPSGTI